MGVKGSLLVEGNGYPLAVCIAGTAETRFREGANINDHLLLAATLDAIVVERPKPSEDSPQNLCLDKGFDNAPTREVVKERGYEEHIRRIGEEKKDERGEKTHPARRWVQVFARREIPGGAHYRVAVTVARHSEPMGKEARKLSGKLKTRVCIALVPKSVASKLTHFEIDS